MTNFKTCVHEFRRSAFKTGFLCVYGAVLPALTSQTAHADMRLERILNSQSLTEISQYEHSTHPRVEAAMSHSMLSPLQGSYMAAPSFIKVAHATPQNLSQNDQTSTAPISTNPDSSSLDKSEVNSDGLEFGHKMEMKADKTMADMTMSASSRASTSLSAASVSMNKILSQYVRAVDASGIARFDYASLSASQPDQEILSDYIKMLEAQDPTIMTDAQATAFWANLYNAVTIKVVIENYPVKSIKDIRSGAFSAGPWKRKLTTVNGKEMTLDDIEHKTLRKRYPSPLIHYMVNCASIGCPNLKSSLWTAKTMDLDREAAARDFVNSPRGARLTSKGLVVSSIYDWFQEDFGGSKSGVLEHLSRYATGDLKAAIDGGAKIKSFDYDWTLNE